MASFSPDFAAAMGACTSQLRGLEHTAKLAERFARVLVQFADGMECACRRTGNAPVECSNELVGFLSSAQIVTRGRAAALAQFSEKCEKALKHQRRYLNYLRERARNVPPAAVDEFSQACATELEKLSGEQTWMAGQFRALVCGKPVQRAQVVEERVPAFPALPNGNAPVL